MNSVSKGPSAFALALRRTTFAWLANRSSRVVGKRERRLARPAGLEPATYGFEVRRSIQLSYGRSKRSSYHLTRNVHLPTKESNGSDSIQDRDQQSFASGDGSHAARRTARRRGKNFSGQRGRDPARSGVPAAHACAVGWRSVTWPAVSPPKCFPGCRLRRAARRFAAAASLPSPRDRSLSTAVSCSRASQGCSERCACERRDTRAAG
jgi:hypothetical protein